MNEREREGETVMIELRDGKYFFLVSCYMRFLLLPLPHVPFSNFINSSHSKKFKAEIMKRFPKHTSDLIVSRLIEMLGF